MKNNSCSDRCPACYSDEKTEFQASEMMYGKGGVYPYFQCLHCEAIWIKDIPEDLAAHYPKNYYAFRQRNGESSVRRFLKKIRYRLFQIGIKLSPPDYFAWIELLGVSTSDKVADIGSGSGELLKQLKVCGFQRLYGFDPYIEKEHIEAGFEMRKMSFDQVSESVDVIMFHHSFEHMSDPDMVFAHLSKILKPGGKVLIRTPVSDAKIWKEESVNWFQLDAPRHLFIPNTKSMEILAARHSFKLVKTVFDSSGNQFAITELYKKGIPLISQCVEKEFSKRELSDFEKEARRLNKLELGDQAAFYLKKI